MTIIFTKTVGNNNAGGLYESSNKIIDLIIYLLFVGVFSGLFVFYRY